MKKSKKGGARAGSGAPKKYNCDTKMMSLRVPVKAIPEIKESAKVISNRYLIVNDTPK